jgi:long-subunit acyl-CoA synthetase (AMP-forming)
MNLVHGWFCFMHDIKQNLVFLCYQMTPDDVFLSFLPLAHILDRMIEEYFFHKGGSVGYYHGVRKSTTQPFQP